MCTIDTRRFGALHRALAGFVLALTIAFGAGPAKAQFVCDNALGGGGAGADASGAGGDNFACGQSADASGDVSFNSATGQSADASGDDSFNSATGFFANASGNNSFNTALGTSADASGDNSLNTALGFFAIASGDGTANVAVGNTAVATGANAVAIGNRARAEFANSAAFGNGAVVTRANQQAFGTASNTYTMAGIASPASKAAQTGPTELVTSDAGGNLATTTLADLGLASTGNINAINAQLANLNRQVGDLYGRSERAYNGIAMAFAMAGVPTLLPGEKLAMTMNYGTFEGTSALALNAAFRLADNMQLTGGIGYGMDESIAGGRVGLRVAW